MLPADRHSLSGCKAAPQRGMAWHRMPLARHSIAHCGAALISPLTYKPALQVAQVPVELHASQLATLHDWQVLLASR